MTPKWLHFFRMITGRSMTRLKRLLMKPWLMLQSRLKLCLSQAAQGWLKTSIFREMSIQLPAILMFTRGTSFDPQPCTKISTRDNSPYARRTSDAFTNTFSISHSLQQLYPWTMLFLAQYCVGVQWRLLLSSPHTAQRIMTAILCN